MCRGPLLICDSIAVLCQRAFAAMATQVGRLCGPERTSSVYRWQSTLIPSRRIVHILCDDPRWLQGIPHIVADWRPLPHQGMGNQRQRFLEAGHVTLCDKTTRSVCVLFERMLGVVDATVSGNKPL